MTKKNKVEDKDEFARILLENVLAIADRQLAGARLTPVEDGGDMAEMEIAVPVRVMVRLSGGAAERLPDGDPPGAKCCVCTRDAEGQIRCWGYGPEPCC